MKISIENIPIDLGKINYTIKNKLELDYANNPLEGYDVRIKSIEELELERLERIRDKRDEKINKLLK